MVPENYKKIQGRRGVTLIELTILILLVSILSIVLITRTNPAMSARLAGAGGRLVTDLNHARRLAMAEYRVYEVRFAGNSYVVGYIDDDTGEFKDVPCPHAGIEPYGMDFSAEGRFAGVTISEANFGRTGSVRFGSFGKPSDANGNELTQAGKIILEHRGRSLGINVIQETGSIIREN